MNKKGIAWLLIGGLLAGLLGGCQKNVGGNSGQENQVGQLGENDQRGQDSQSGSSGEVQAMGRYRETEIEIPEEIKSQSFIQFMRGDSGNFELYTVNRNSEGNVIEAFCYIYQGGNWETNSDWTGNSIIKEKGIDLNNVVYGQDGNYYLGGTDEDYVYHLLKLEKDGTTSELLEDVFKPKDGQNYGMIPPKFEVLEDGNLFIYSYWDAYLYEPSGNRLFSIAKDFSGSTDDARGFCEGEEFITVQEGDIVRCSLRDGKVLETIDYGEIKGNREIMELFGDGLGGIYVANEVGVSHVNRGGNLWEILIDGSLNHMGMRSLYIRRFLKGEDEDYYGAFTSEGGKGFQLFHYEYDPNMSAVPPSILTVYSLKDYSTVRQAASQFQSEHPEVKVEVRTAVEDGGNVTEEIIQGLNTELLSGKGADILILDSLPVASYIEKGILMDISDVIGEMENSGDMLNNLLDGFREEDGAIYQVPARIEFPMVLGEEKAVQAYSSLKTIVEYQGEKPLFSTDKYENLLRKLSRLCYEELFGNEDSMADRSKLIYYLESTKAIGESNGSKTAFSENEMETNHFVTNNVLPNGIIGSAIDYDRGVCDSGTEEISSYTDLCIPVEVRNLHPEIQMMPVGNIYLPSKLAGINRATNNEEMAKEFIRCLLSYEVQKEELYDGFPVNKKALHTITETEKEISIGSGYPGYYISGDYPSLEVRKEVEAMVEQLTVPAVVDETVMKMIVEGSRDYFDGKESVEQAADAIMRKLSIYLAE